MITLGFVAWLCVGAAAAFHPPATSAERALDKIIRLADNDPYGLDTLLGRKRAPKGNAMDYEKVLTRPLIEALRREERDMVRKDCGGRYLAGYVCGFDFNPVSCAQDSDPVRLFQTVRAARPATILRFRYAQAGPDETNSYRLVRDGGAWKIDDILCAQQEASFRKLLSS